MVRKAFTPTDGQEHIVKATSTCGVRQTDIATWVGLRSPKTRRKHFPEEIDRGRIGADAEAGKTLHKKAISGSVPTFYYLNRQASRRARLTPAAVPAAIPHVVVTAEQEAA
jgi:hypothetical protein